MTYRVDAHNTATLSDNKIHDDEVARSFGFSGGLVPGVDVYAYLTHLPAERWGLAWLEHGTIRARFHQPVYDGDAVTVGSTGDEVLDLVLRDSRGETCATGSASVGGPDGAANPGALDDIPVVPAPAHAARPPASAESLPVGAVLGAVEVGFHADRAGDYLDDVRETLALYRDEGVAHPGWLLRWANAVLVANVVLGPWIHVSSDVRHVGLVHDGARLSVRARVAGLFERKGHRFVALDVQMVADDERTVLRAEHTAIYEPRRQP